MPTLLVPRFGVLSLALLLPGFNPSVLVFGPAECTAPEPGAYADTAQRLGGTKVCHHLFHPQRV